MTRGNTQLNQDSFEVKLTQALSDADTAKRRATLALAYAKEALKDWTPPRLLRLGD